MKSKKAQASVIEAFFLFLVFFIFWFAWLGKWVNQVSDITLATGNFTGLEAFFYANLNVVVWIFALIGLIGWSVLRTE